MSKSIAMKALSVLMALAMALYCDLPVQMAYAAQDGGAQAQATAQSTSADSGSSASAGQAAGISSASAGTSKPTSTDSQAASTATGDSEASASAKTQSTATAPSNSAAMAPQADPTWTGSGTEADPYMISTAAQLAELATYANDSANTTSGKYWKLANDIALASAWTVPIGNSTTPFKGSFDGSSKTVSGLDATSVSGKDAGLFGYLKSAAIKNLTVDGKAGSQSNVYAGGIAGQAESSAVSGCSSCAAVVASSSGYGGGIIGSSNNNTTISECASSGTVNAKSAGGITGYVIGGEISGCLSGASLTGVSHSGGIAGYATNYYGAANTKILRSANKGSVTASGNGSRAGGIVGTVAGIDPGGVDITDCYNSGAITGGSTSTKKSGTPYAAGVVACPEGGTTAITNCYNSGTIAKTGTWSTDYRYGQIAPAYDLSGNDFSGFTVVAVSTSNCVLTNCYAATDTFDAASLGSSFKNDVTGVNAGYPLLTWEKADDTAMLSGLSYSVDGGAPVALTLTQLGAALGTGGATVALTGAAPAAKVTLTPTLADSTATVTSNDGATLSGGAGTAKVTTASADGKTTRTYTVNFESTFAVTVDGSISNGSASASPANALPGATVTVTTAPASGYATLGATVTGASGASVDVAWKSLNTYEFTMPSEPVTVSATFTDSSGFLVGGETITQALIDSRGGDSVFHVSPAASGTITVADGLEVTLVGTGSLATDPKPDVSVQCGSGVHLTLRDMRLSSGSATSGMDTVNFPSGDNVLTIEGSVLIERDTDLTGYCAVHVPAASSLLVNGDGALYLYKHEQGAGIGSHGGNGGAAGSESSGAITFGDPITSTSAGSPNLRVFAKGSKQGALIGTGAGTSTATSTGTITFNSGTYTLMTNSRASAIGGGAGSPAVAGGDVFVKGGSIDINLDYSGAAIGGGGFVSGNDSSGGHIYVDGGSIRTYIDSNAVDPDGDGDTSDTLWTGITAAGVSDAGITAVKSNSTIGVDSANTADKAALLAFDASQLKDTALSGSTAFDVSIDGEAYPVAGLHLYKYVYEQTSKTVQEANPITDTRSNWVYNTSDGTASGTPGDTNLYLYAAMYGSDGATAATHTVTVNGQSFYYKYDTQTKAFAELADIAGADIAAIPDQAWTGSAITPVPEVTLGGKKLVAGTDYTVTYEDADGKAVAAPTAAGTYTLVIAGTGDYAGTVAAKSTFTIAAPTGDRIVRLAGDGALDTMKTITGTGWSDKSGGTVIVATDGGYYDALTASALAGVSEGSVLLTNGGKLSSQTASELARIKPSKVVVAGGTGAVTDGVKGQIAAAAGLPDSAVSRVYGDSATDTADAIWAEAKAEGLTSDTCVIATSDGFADALSAAPAAYAKGYPIFLAGPGATLSAHTLAAIKDAGFTKAVVVGGKGVLPVEKIDDVLKAETGVTSVSRYAGDTCFQTSTAVAKWEIGALGMSADKLAVATADSYSDALCGAALCGRNGSILVLATPSDTSCITGGVHDNASSVTRAYIFGGTGVLPDDTIKAPLAKALG